MTDRPGRQQLSGYVLRDYDHAIATLGEARRSTEVPVADLAERFGLHRTTVHRWFTGDQVPDSALFFALASALGHDLALIPRETP